MISATNPIHRLRDIIQRIAELGMQMVPFYEAADTLGWKDVEGDLDYDRLEHNPAFRVLFLERNALREEQDRILMRLALSYEFHPVNNI